MPLALILPDVKGHHVAHLTIAQTDLFSKSILSTGCVQRPMLTNQTGRSGERHSGELREGNGTYCLADVIRDQVQVHDQGS